MAERSIKRISIIRESTEAEYMRLRDDYDSAFGRLQKLEEDSVLQTDLRKQVTSARKDVASAEHTYREQEKTLIMVHRQAGYRATLVALRYLFQQAGVRFAGFLSMADDDVYTSDDTAPALGGGAAKKRNKSRKKATREPPHEPQERHESHREALRAT